MEALNKVSELIQTSIGVEGQLLTVRKIHDTLIEEVGKKLIPRSEAAMYFGPGDIPGSSIDVNLDVPNTLDIREVGEGAAIPFGRVEQTSFNLKPKKYGVAIRITREFMEDSKWNILERNIKVAAKRFAENENELIILNALDNAANTVTGGASAVIGDITNGLQKLEDNDYQGNVLFVGTEFLQDMRNIDTFIEAQKIGNTEMLEKGFLGVLFGMRVILVSPNAGMVKTSAYVVDRDEGYCIAEKRALTVEGFDLATHDMTGVAITQRIAVRQVRAEAICKITTT